MADVGALRSREQILIVEDDQAMNRGIALTLAEDHRHMFSAYTLKQAKEIFEQQHLDLILLDVTLPDGSGLDFCRTIRFFANVPIIFLTANNSELDVVTGLEMGGDDYITKPFQLMVLRTRVMAVLRRAQGVRSSCFHVGDMTFDFDKMVFRKAGEPILLSVTEQKLLRLLVSNAGHVLTRDRLMQRLYPDETAFVDDNALTVCIRRLRQKIEDHPAAPLYIKTIHGLGYSWKGAGEP